MLSLKVGALLLAVGAVVTAPAGRSGKGTAGPPPHGAPAAQGPQDVPLLAARTKGSLDAPITIVEASDFQCPFCRVFWEETLPGLEREYLRTGKAKLIFINLPLPQIHPNATPAHEFAMCAAMQDRFWPVHDLLYRHQATWARLSQPAPYFRQLADSAGLDRAKLEQCFNTGAVRRLIQQEVQMNVRAGIRSTPTFVIERGLLEGAVPLEDWRPILDSIFAAKTGRN
jgi:protein-disulfide isomerase